MKVKIVKCSGPRYWYKNYIGSIFEVEKLSDEEAGEHLFNHNDNVKYKVISAISLNFRFPAKDEDLLSNFSNKWIDIIDCVIVDKPIKLKSRYQILKEQAKI